MITENDIEIYIGLDRIRATLVLSVEKKYGLKGINPRDHDKMKWIIIDNLKKEIMEKVYGNQSPTGYESTPYHGP